MSTLTYQKSVQATYIIAIASLITMPDAVFGLMLEIMHLLFEVLHLMFEFLESTLDHIIEHIFHTDLHETQVIVFYIIVSMACGGLYYLWRIMPRFFRKLKDIALAALLQRKVQLQNYWAEQSFFDKVKLFLITNAGFAAIMLVGF